MKLTIGDRVWERALLTVGVFKLIALVLFFASFSTIGQVPAQAQSDASCSGKNLADHFQQTDPTKFEEIIAEADKVLNGNSLLWKIEKQGFATSWMMGTMHLSHPDVSGLTDRTKQVIANVDTVVIETLDVLDKQAMVKAMQSLAHLTMLPADEKLTDLIAADLRDELEAETSTRGMPMQLVDRLQPWLVATSVALPVCELARKQSGEPVLDVAIANYAKENGKALKGLETVKEQFEAMASLPREFHISALEQTLASGSNVLDMLTTMKDLFLEEKISMVFPLMQASSPEIYTGDDATKFQEALIEKRNLTMAERSLSILGNGASLIAVGALHIPGDTGLVELLRSKGFTVTAQ